jgi:hypothetical protein
MQNGDMFSPTPSKDAVLEDLPIGNYIVVETMQGLMFKRTESFEKPGRMYGDINDRATRILRTFADRPRATGVLLEGEKGSGKSQLARNISYAGYDMGYPTILINAPFAGDAFNALLATVEQPAIVLFDEFEKVYEHRQQQEQILTLLDGVMTTRKLFILTVNDKYAVNQHMHNRPGRIYYSLQFDGLETSFVREYCADNLDDKDETENIVKIGMMFRAFNFDILKALVEEMNRYKENAYDALEYLNAQPIAASATSSYQTIAIASNGARSAVVELNELPMTSRGNYVSSLFNFEEAVPAGGKKDELSELLGLDEDLDRHLMIKSQDLKKIDVDKERFEFEVDGFTVIFQKKAATFYDLRSMSMGGAMMEIE